MGRTNNNTKRKLIAFLVYDETTHTWIRHEITPKKAHKKSKLNAFTDITAIKLANPPEIPDHKIETQYSPIELNPFLNINDDFLTNFENSDMGNIFSDEFQIPESPANFFLHQSDSTCK